MPIFKNQNIQNQKVRDMEEKKLNEEQVAEQTTSQEVNKVESELDSILNENKRLKEHLDTTADSLAWARREYMAYMAQSDILKKTLEELCKRKSISKAEMYEAMMTANDMELDDVLSRLSKTTSH